MDFMKEKAIKVISEMPEEKIRFHLENLNMRETPEMQLAAELLTAELEKRNRPE